MDAQTSNTLTPQQQGIVAISALTATGDLKNLDKELNIALNAGLTINEIKEIMTQLYAYCGFPRSLNALGTLRKVLEERSARGIADKGGKEIAVDNNIPDRYEQGRQVLEKLTRTPQVRPAPGYGEFTPRIDVFLKEHLFGDIFCSDVLSYQQREIATIATLASMDGVAPQLKAHIGMGMNTGIIRQQLTGIFDWIENHIGKNQAEIARYILSKIETKN